MNRPRRRRYELQDRELNDLVERAVDRAEAVYGGSEGRDFVRQMMVTALRMVRDKTAVADLKMTNSALKELRHAFRIFEPYEHIRKVAVFGSARTKPSHPDWKQAHAFSQRIVDAGWMVITGAGDGIMGAAQGGAGRDRSFGVNIRLPFEQAANEVIAGDSKLINFRYFFTRKVIFVKEAHAIVLFPGGFGTHDEGFEALTLIQTGKSEMLPVVFVDEPGGSYGRDWREYVETHLLARGLISREDGALFRVTDSVDVAIHEVMNFYSNYHSSRYVGDDFVVRVNLVLTDDQIQQLNDEFAVLVRSGHIYRSDGALKGEQDHRHLPRIVFTHTRNHFSIVRRMIDRVNDFGADDATAGRQPLADAG
jgi:uncharacterized protein (TIGR00730 family)